MESGESLLSLYAAIRGEDELQTRRNPKGTPVLA
jgi:hypothetical protein